MKKAALIFNPRAGSWRTEQRIAAIRGALAEIGFDTEPLPTESPGHATELAHGAALAGADVVFTHGGDGTLREAAAGLLASQTALAPIPGGTANVVANALGLPKDPVAAVHHFAETETQEMDVGLCGEQIFLMQISAGLDAHIMGNLDPALKRRFGKAAIAYSGLLRFPSYHYAEIELIADGRPASATLMAVCNLPYYAGAFQMAPGASISDGFLDLVLFRGRGPLATLGFARDLALGRHLKRRDVELVRVKEVELRGPKELAIQLDGDAIPLEMPLTISLHPQRILLLKPRPPLPRV